jgi:hypothetical protein
MSLINNILALILSLFKTTGVNKSPATNVDDGPTWMNICDADLTVDWNEVPGEQNNPRIVDAFKAAGYGALPDETNWCGVYAASVLTRAGFKPPKEPAWARNYSESNWGTLLFKPKYGAVVNIERNGPGGDSHVGFVVSFDDRIVRIQGGNQSNGVNRHLVAQMKDVISFKWPTEKL